MRWAWSPHQPRMLSEFPGLVCVRRASELQVGPVERSASGSRPGGFTSHLRGDSWDGKSGARAGRSTYLVLLQCADTSL